MRKQRIVRKQPEVLDAMLFDGTEESAKDIVQWVLDCNESAAYLEGRGTVSIVQDANALQLYPFDYLVRPRGKYGDFYTIPQQDLLDDFHIIQ